MLKLEVIGFCDGTNDFAGVPTFRSCITAQYHVDVYRVKFVTGSKKTRHIHQSIKFS